MNRLYRVIAGIVVSIWVTNLEAITFIVPKRWEHPQAMQGSRQSSYPYISGDTFRAISDFIIDEKYIPFDPERVTQGDIIFVNADHMDFFFTTVHPHIRMPYILITHNSDFAIPGKWKKHLDDATLIAWFGQNYDGTQHAKIFPIPIGLANRHWPHGDIAIVDRIRAESATCEKKHLAYLNFIDGTNSSKRVHVRDFFKDKAFCFSAPRKPYVEYLKDLAQSKFVICPEGNGFDCHRTWEALLVGSIPVLLHSPLDPLFTGLHVLLVNGWSEVTQEFLLDIYAKMQQQSFVYEKMFAQYWLNKIDSIKRETKRRIDVDRK